MTFRDLPIGSTFTWSDQPVKMPYIKTRDNSSLNSLGLPLGCSTSLDKQVNQIPMTGHMLARYLLTLDNLPIDDGYGSLKNCYASVKVREGMISIG
jgi:hypothetical protein